MRKSLLIIAFISIFIVGCSSTQTNNPATKKKPQQYTRKITTEEQGYIQLVTNKDYDTLDKQTQNQSNEVQKDYNNIAFVLKNYQQAQKLEQDNNPTINAHYIELLYGSIPGVLEQIKFIPNDIKKQIDEVKNTSLEKDKYYLNLVKTQDQQDQLEQKQNELNQQSKYRTENPQQVKIGMTQDEVLTDGWGKPNEINKTTTANETSEQWVYSGNRYLYFENGILETIQD
jgi:hypothetical protein